MAYSFVDINAKARLYREVGALMVDAGYLADPPYWRRKGNETIASLFIENYRGGFLFYVSLGVYVLGLSEKGTRKPKLAQMHAWTRLAQLTPVTTQANGHVALVGDGSEDTNKIIDDVLEAIKTAGFEILDELSSLVGTKRVLDKYNGEIRWHIGPLLKARFYGSRCIEVCGTLPLRDWEKAGSVRPCHKDKGTAVS